MTLRLVCGGKHTIEIIFDSKLVEGSPFTLDVSGTPKVGARVRHGPDWKEQRREVGMFLMPGERMPNVDANEEGTVQGAQHSGGWGFGVLDGQQFGLYGQSSGGLQLGGHLGDQQRQATTTTTTVNVCWDKRYGHCTYSHNWGGTYEIELV